MNKAKCVFFAMVNEINNIFDKYTQEKKGAKSRKHCQEWVYNCDNQNINIRYEDNLEIPMKAN